MPGGPARAMHARHPVAFIGLGANLPSPGYGPPLATLTAAAHALAAEGIDEIRRSRWYRSAPVPPSDQPPYVNGVLAVSTGRPPRALLSLLHEIEQRFGRVRTVANAPRLLDLDLLAYGDEVCAEPGGLTVPHPRLHERAFVLRPWAELAPGWRHPLLGRSVAEMLAALPHRESAVPMEEPAAEGSDGTAAGARSPLLRGARNA